MTPHARRTLLVGVSVLSVGDCTAGGTRPGAPIAEIMQMPLEQLQQLRLPFP